MHNSKLYKLFESKNLTFAFIIINCILIPFYYLHRVAFLSNDFLILIFDIIKSWLVLFFFAMLFLPKKSEKLSFGFVILSFVIIYGIYWILFNLLVGYAKGFSNG